MAKFSVASNARPSEAERLFGAVENFGRRPPQDIRPRIGGRAIAVILAPHADSICSANVPSPPAAPCTSTFFPAAFSRVSPGAADRKPHRHEAVGKCCQRLKIAAGRGAAARWAALTRT